MMSETVKKISQALGRELPVKSLLSSGTSVVGEIELDQKADDICSFSYADLYSSSAPKISYKPFSPYPFIVRDIAVFVPENPSVGADDVWTEIKKGVEDAQAAARDTTETDAQATGGEAILVRHSLFDTFKKDGKISYAFRLIFQSMNRTLTDLEANAVMDKIYAKMTERGWQVR
jgi:phenylalanyl-tRNA synthetase beta subunit